MAKSRSFYLNSKEGIVGWYDKRLLTPGGEFLPYSLDWAAKLISSESKDYLESVRFFSKGMASFSPVNFKEAKIGGLICSGLFSPSFNRSLAENDANLIVVQASTGIMGDDKSFINHSLSVSRMRAAENKKPLMFATNYGISYFINSSGNIEKIALDDSPKILTATVVLNSEKTLYNKVGDVPFLMAFFAVTVLSFLMVGIKRRNGLIQK